DREQLRAELDRLGDELINDGAAPAALARLQALRELRAELDIVLGRSMQVARAAEHDWADIGGALGMSGQAASERYRRHHQLPDPRPGRDRPVRRGTYRPRDE